MIAVNIIRAVYCACLSFIIGANWYGIYKRPTLLGVARCGFSTIVAAILLVGVVGVF